MGFYFRYREVGDSVYSIQFNDFIPDSTEHIQQVYVTLRSICYIRHTICAVYKSTEQCIKETCIQLFQSSVYIQKLVPVFTDPGSES